MDLKAQDISLENSEEFEMESLNFPRKRRLLKKAPEAPKRFKSAYICFVMDKMERVKESLPSEIKVTDIMKELATMWRNLPPLEKKEYEDRAEADKSRYFEEMANYSGPMQVPNRRRKKPVGAPKRAMSAFLSYSQQMRPQIREEFPDLKNTDISGVLAQRWKEASEEEKRPHLEREMREREKYHDDMAKWKLEEREKEKSREEQQYKTTMDYLDLPSAALWDAMTNDDSTNSTKGVYSANVGVPFYQYDGNSFNNAFWDASDNLTDGSCSVSQKSGGASEISDILGKSRKDGSAPRKNNFPREAGGEDGFWNDKVQCGLNAYVDNIDREEETQSRVSAKELDKQRGKTETSLLGNSKYLYHRTIEFYDGSYGPYDSDAYSNDNGSTVASSISSGTTSVGSWYSFDPRYGGNSMNYSNPSQNIVKTTDSAGSVQKDAKYNVHNSKKTTGNINTPLDLYSNPAWTQKSCDLSAISPRANLESLGKYYTSHHQNYLQKNPLSRMNDNSSVEEGKSKNFKVGRKMDEALAGDSMKPPVGSLTKRPRNTVDNLGSLMTATSSFYLSEHPESSTT